MKVGSLFAGIGGFDLGFQRAGFEIAWQVEIDDYCQKVLAKHFPAAQRFGDIRETSAATLAPVDVICGGFPCQDISLAGKGAGLAGERSGLWFEYLRLIGELRPRFVVVENVRALLVRGMDRVIGDLAGIGYDAEWEVISAADVGAHHLRKRVWIVAYPSRELQHGAGNAGQIRGNEYSNCGTDVAYPKLPQRARFGQHGREILSQQKAIRFGFRRSSLAHASRFRLERFGKGHYANQPHGDDSWSEIAGRSAAATTSNPDFFAPISAAIARGEYRDWEPESRVGRVAHGVPSRVDRLKGLGNAIVPKIAELLAHRIAEVSYAGN